MASRRWFIALTCLLAAGAEPQGPRWLTDYGQALEVARASGRPLFVVFRCEH
jgi:hypothetical protein